MTREPAERQRFEGEICGVGTRSGHRFVVGRWERSPFGSFTDVMHEGPGGLRRLLAPTPEVAEYVASTYGFDDVEVVPVAAVRSPGLLAVTAGSLELEVALGGRTAVGWLLRSVPPALGRSPRWCEAIDPIASRVLPGVHTAGTAGQGRREWYGAHDQHRVRSVTARLDGQDVGAIAEVWPPVRFGFSSTPRRPSLVRVTTTIGPAA